MAKILVTGGAGFIGTHLCRQLRQAAHDVTVLDLKAPQTAIEGVCYTRGDVRDPADLARALAGVDAVYHFAAIVSVPVCQQSPLESYETNLKATISVLDAIRTEREKSGRSIKLIFAGSSVVYGNLTQLGEARGEQSQVAWPPSFYGAQKLNSEHAITLYCENFKIPAVVFRFFNVYGVGQDPSSPYSGVISIFSQCLKDGRSLRLNGGGAQTRDFVSVKDVARACFLALKLPEDRCDGKAINLGTGRSVTIRQLAEEMVKASGRDCVLEDAPPRSGDVMHSKADRTRAKEVLGWEPEISLAEGLRELLNV